MSEQSAARRVLEDMKQRAAETGEPSHDTVDEFRAKVTVEFVKGVKVIPVGGIGYAWPDDQQE